MQICVRFRWRNAMVKSDGSGSKGLTPYTRLLSLLCAWILISSCWPTDIRLLDFCRKRALGPDQSHYNQSRLWSRLHTTLAKLHGSLQMNIHWTHCIGNFFTVQDFWATCACPEKQSCPEIFHSIEIFFIIQDFWAGCICFENRVFPIFQAGGLSLSPAAPPCTPLRTAQSNRTSCYWLCMLFLPIWIVCLCSFFNIRLSSL